MIEQYTAATFKIIVFWVCGIVALWFALSVFGFASLGTFPSVDASKWQAVFLSNNQVYFGKLENLDGSYLTLSHVYYLRTAADLNQGSGDSSINLIKLGGELHGPEDVMYIPKTNVLFWENMKSTSQVVETITKTQSSQ